MEKSGRGLRKIASHYTYLPQGLTPSVVISLNNQGVIEKIERCNTLDNIHGLEFYSGILIPAMVNAHSHLELSHLGGVITPKCGFATFANGVSSSRGRFSDQQRRNAMEFYDAKMWSEGVCVVGDVSNGASSFGVKKDSKIKYHTFLELFGLRGCDRDRLEKLRDDASSMGLANSLTVHSTYSLNCNDFDSVVGGCDDGILSIHFMESRGEEELYRGVGELSDWYKKCGMSIDFDIYDSPVDRVLSTISPSRKVLLIHNTMISDGDIVALKEHFGENLTFVLCPRSNLHITGEKPSFKSLLESGCRVAIGTDSMASNSSLSLIDEMKEIEGVDLETQLKWVTESGAYALGVGDMYGRIEVGRSCGLVVLEGVDLENFKLTPDTLSRRII